MTFRDEIVEGIRLVRTSERILGVVSDVRHLSSSLEAIGEIAPDLRPELDAMGSRLIELAEHLHAAQVVAGAKLDELYGR